jgi:hypothetical protein
MLVRNDGGAQGEATSEECQSVVGVSRMLSLELATRKLRCSPFRAIEILSCLYVQFATTLLGILPVATNDINPESALRDENSRRRLSPQGWRDI